MWIQHLHLRWGPLADPFVQSDLQYCKKQLGDETLLSMSVSNENESKVMFILVMDHFKYALFYMQQEVRKWEKSCTEL